MEPFNVLAKLHEGSFSNVYLCERKYNKQKIVVKKIKNVEQQSDLNEATILKLFKHPNVIRYQDSVIKNRELYIVMDFAKNTTLHEFIVDTKPKYFRKSFVLSVLCQILMGLAHIHEKKVIHHDLKCENIFLSGTYNYIVKIGDFSASKILTGAMIKADGITCGTSNYIAPEICYGQYYNTKADMWSLGCILYELCARERLFEGSIDKITADCKAGRRKSISIDRYGNHIQTIINQLIEITPELRPSASELLAHGILFPRYYLSVLHLGALRV